MSGSGTRWVHCEEHCERNHYVSHWGHCDHIDGHIVKELNMCPLGVTNWHFSRSFRLIILNAYDPYLSEPSLISLTTLVLNHFAYSFCLQKNRERVY